MTTEQRVICAAFLYVFFSLRLVIKDSKLFVGCREIFPLARKLDLIFVRYNKCHPVVVTLFRGVELVFEWDNLVVNLKIKYCNWVSRNWTPTLTCREDSCISQRELQKLNYMMSDSVKGNQTYVKKLCSHSDQQSQTVNTYKLVTQKPS